jgi:hypothetical protein
MNGSFAEFLMSSTESGSESKELCEKIRLANEKRARKAAKRVSDAAKQV